VLTLKQRVSASVEELYRRMEDYGDNQKLLGGNEMLTRYILIDPVLRTLGWEMEDPGNVLVGEPIRLQSNKLGHPDYTLFYKGKRVAYVEAKCWGTMYRISHKGKISDIERQKEYRQLARYCRECKENDMPLGILTDGGSWWVCDFRKRSFGDIVKERIDLGTDSKASVVSFLLKLRPGSVSSLLK
jgi:predicted type IV restriction endonuclease